MAVLGPEKRYIYILGGQNDMEDVMLKLNRLYVLDTKTWRWYKPNVQGPKPVGRMFGSALLLNNENYAVFAFGQEKLGIYSNDIDVLKLPSFDNEGNPELSSMKWLFGGGAIAGIVIACIALIAILIALCFFRRFTLQVIRMIHFSPWNPRNGEPRWLEASFGVQNVVGVSFYAQSPIGLIQRWPFGASRQSILKGIQSRFVPSGETPIPFVSPVSYYSNRALEPDHESHMVLDTNNNQQQHATTTTWITNKGDESALPMHIADNNDQRMVALEDRIHLLERVFRSYCVDDEVLYLLNESVKPPRKKQRRHSNNVSSQQTRLGCFFRRTSPARSNSQRQCWIQVPNAAGRQTDLLSTSSSISPLEEPESDTSKSPTP